VELAESNDALLRGASLTDATAFSRENPSLVGNLERRFLEASERNQQRESERQERRSVIFRRLSVALAVLTVVAVAGLALALVQWRHAEHARTAADDARRAAQASFAREADLRREQKAQLDKIANALEKRKLADAQTAVVSAQARLASAGVHK